jgi:hypothetical protein
MPKYQIKPFNMVLSISLFFLANFLVSLLSPIIINTTITFTMVYSMITAIIFYLNYDLVKSHWVRCQKCKDKILFFFIGILSFMVILLLNKFYFYAFIYTIDVNTFTTYMPLSILFLIAYSLFYAFNFSIAFKLVTNFFVVHNRELLFIVVSALLFGIVWSLSLFPVTTFAFMQMSILYALISLVFSYLYNQTNTIMVPAISLTISLLILNLINIIL